MRSKSITARPCKAETPYQANNKIMTSQQSANSQPLLQTVRLEDYIETLHFAPDGNTLVSALTHNDVTLWRVSAEHIEPQFSFPSGLKRLYDIAVSPDGTRLATAGQAEAGKKQLIIWRLPQGEKEREFGFSDSYLLSAAFSPDGTRLLFMSLICRRRKSSSRRARNPLTTMKISGD